MSTIKDHTGERFGMLVALRPEGHIEASRKIVAWRFRCDCGNEVVRRYDSVKGAKYGSSCGCKHHGQLTPWAASIEQRAYKKFCTKSVYDGHTVTLSLEEWVQLVKSNCYYCGTEPKERWVDNTSGPRWNANGIDRIDSSLEYDLENVVPCCSRCNSMKSNLTQSEFMEQVFKISAFHGAKRGV